MNPDEYKAVDDYAAKIVVTTQYESEECEACDGWGVIPWLGRTKAVTCAICNGAGETRRPTAQGEERR
jgi:DnaJ-class molecular chaperone